MKFLFAAALSIAVFGSAGQSLACTAYTNDLGQTWRDGPQDYWYGASQGSRMMPLSWYRALQRADDGTPFGHRANMALYGFEFCDDQATDPIGFVIDDDPVSGPAIGLNCAACHTGSLTTDGKTSLLVHGGTARMDLQAFTADLVDAARALHGPDLATAEKTKLWQRFATQVLGSSDTPQTQAQLYTELSDWLAYRAEIQTSIAAGGKWGHGRQDAVQVILNTVAVLSDGAQKNGLPPATAPVSIPSVWLAPNTARVQWNGSSFKAKDVGLSGPISTGAMIRNISEAIGVFAEVKLPSYADLARANYVDVTSSIRLENLIRLERALSELPPPRWPDAFGALDRTSAQYQRGEALYTADCADCHARVDAANPFTEIVDASTLPLGPNPANGAPFVRVVNAFATPGDTGATVDTDPMNACNALTHSTWTGKLSNFTNVFEALRSYTQNGVTGVSIKRFPPGTETLRLIEDISIRILWDKRGDISAVQASDAANATTGFFNWFTGTDVALDAGDWAIAKGVTRGEPVPVITPSPGTHALKTLDEVRRVCTQQLQRMRRSNPDLPPPGYKAGPLIGIFASAPYLHNGSVPTLDALLLPPDQRPLSFTMGAVLFDPVKVGLGVAIAGAPTSQFQVLDSNGTATPGNWNGGHAYPVNPLSDADRAALISYLKGL
ncbi:MAG: di-heme-cytochrome C peroxidase [Cypionkella sp.]